MESNDKKLSWGTIIGYGMGEAGTQFSWALISSYLTVYYSDVVGLTPIVISTIMLIARIWDAINDPMFGTIAENYTHTRWGRFRPYILFGAPLLALFNCLTFLNLNISSGAKAIWCGAIYICCGMVYTAVSISVGSVPNCMTVVNKERVTLQASRNIVGNVASLIINAIAMPMILYFGNGSTSNGKGYFMAALIFSVICIPCLIICFVSIRERIAPNGQKKDVEKKVGLLTSFKQAMVDHNARLLIIAMVFVLVAIMGRMGIQAYYFIYVLGDAGKMAACVSAMGLGMLLPGVYVPFLLNRIDKKWVGAAGNILMGACCIALYLAAETGASLTVLIAIHFIMGLTNTQQVTCFTLAAEIIDDNWIRTGHRVDGTLYACVSFATKFGNAIGGSVGILVLSAVGFVANTQMNETVLSNMNKVINFGPFIFFVLAAIFFGMISMTNTKGRDNEEIIKKMLEEQKIEE